MASLLFKQFGRNFSATNSRNFSVTNSRNLNVTVVGAAGGIGQPLCLILKKYKLIDKLVLHDLDHSIGVAADLSHIDTKTKVKAFKGADKLKDSCKGADLVVVPAGKPRKPGMTRDELFSANANVAKAVAEAVGAVCPNAYVIFITNPINAMVPVACAAMDKTGKGNTNKVLGCTTLDLLRSSVFVGRLKKLDPKKVHIPVIGGHAGSTIIPLLSQCKPKVSLSDDEIKKLTKRIQNAGTEVVKAKAGKGSATLSMAVAAARCTAKCLKAIKGDTQKDCLYVRSKVTKSKYFSTPLLLGKNGIEKNYGVPKGISAYEKQLVDACVKTLAASIKKGEAWGKK